MLRRVPRTRQASPAPVQQRQGRPVTLRVRQAQARPCARPRASAVHAQRSDHFLKKRRSLCAGGTFQYFSVSNVLTLESADCRIYGGMENENTARRMLVLKRVPRTWQASPTPMQQRSGRTGELRVRQAQARPCARLRASAVHAQRTRPAARSEPFCRERWFPTFL